MESYCSHEGLTLSISLSTSADKITCLWVCLSVCLSIYLSVCLSDCLSETFIRETFPEKRSFLNSLRTSETLQIRRVLCNFVPCNLYIFILLFLKLHSSLANKEPHCVEALLNKQLLLLLLLSCSSYHFIALHYNQYFSIQSINQTDRQTNKQTDRHLFLPCLRGTIRQEKQSGIDCVTRQASPNELTALPGDD